MTSLGFLEVFPDQPVLSPARARVRTVQTTAAFAHPRTGGDHRRAAYRMAAYDGAIGAQGSSLAYARTHVRAMHRKMRPRGTHIREYTRRAAEYVILQLYAFVDGYVVLDTDAVSDPDVVRDIDILSQRTVAPDDGSLLNMAEMPNLRSRADGHAIVDITAFVNEVVLHSQALFSNIAGAQ